MFSSMRFEYPLRQLATGLFMAALVAFPSASLLAHEQTVAEQTVIDLHERCGHRHECGCGHASCGHRHKGSCGAGRCDRRRPAAPTHEHAQVQCEDSHKDLKLSVNFGFNEDGIDGEAESKLSELSKELSPTEWAGAKVALSGNADTVDSTGYNEGLSAQRAENVKRWLVSHNNSLQADNVTVRAMGESAPIEEPARDNFRSRTNRRVDIVIASGAQHVHTTTCGPRPARVQSCHGNHSDHGCRQGESCHKTRGCNDGYGCKGGSGCRGRR